MSPGLSALAVILLFLPQAQKLPIGQPRMALDLVVSGPKESQPGDLVVLDSANSQGVSATAWAVSPKSAEGRMLPVEQNSKIVFATATPGRYTFFLSGCTADGKTIKIIAHEVIVGGNPVPPGPDPVPPDPPGPNPPPPNPDKYGLSAFVLSRALAVSDSDKVANSQKFAAACDVVISQIGAGALKSPKDIAAAFEQQLGGVGLVVKYKWKTALWALADKFDALALTDPKDWMQAFTEVADGLRRVK